LIIPPLKRIVNEYEKVGTAKSMRIISIISATFFFLIFYYLTNYDPEPVFGPVALFFWYFGYILWGYFALFLLHDYRQKHKIKKRTT
jgi:hypothetical protein